MAYIDIEKYQVSELLHDSLVPQQELLSLILVFTHL